MCLRILCIFGLLAAVSAFGQGPPRVVAVSIEGDIHPITVEIIGHAIERAQSENAAMLLVRINTPGGLLDATRVLIQKLDSSPIPVVTYVEPSGARGASAGFFVLEAGDVAAMAPGTNTGASSPVLMAGQMDQVMRNKVENDAAAMLRSMMSRRGRNSAVGEQSIRHAKSTTEKEALDQKLIELIANSEQQLLEQLDGREITRWDGRKLKLHLAGASVTEAPRTLREKVIVAIADPNIGFILLVLGVLGIYVEFTSPGLIFPGIAGAILALLGLSSLSILPIKWTAGYAHSPFHRARGGAAVRGHHDVPGFDGHQGAAKQGAHRRGRNDRATGRSTNRAATGGASAGARRILGRYRAFHYPSRRRGSCQRC